MFELIAGIVLAGIVLAGGSFYAGSRYGRSAELQAIAIELLARKEYNTILTTLRQDSSAALARLRSWL
jgi:hypothetical protein